MAPTTLTTPETASRLADLGGGGGSFQSGDFGGGSAWDGRTWGVTTHTYKLAMWFGLTAVVMLFAAFTSALVVRKGMSLDWVSTEVPRILWLNTIVLLASSLALELSRRALSAGRMVQFNRLLQFALVLGLGFLAGQWAAWTELAARGVYLATNPSSSFFYLLTAAHAIHLVGGVAALSLAVLRARRLALEPARRTLLDVTALYWHFMDALWIYIFFLLLRWA